MTFHVGDLVCRNTRHGKIVSIYNDSAVIEWDDYSRSDPVGISDLQHDSDERMVPIAGDRKKNPDTVRVRNRTVEEILALRAGSHVPCLLNNGRLGQVKINGRVRTWKRDPTRVEVPIKYGMYEFAQYDLQEALRRLVVEVGS